MDTVTTLPPRKPQAVLEPPKEDRRQKRKCVYPVPSPEAFERDDGSKADFLEARDLHRLAEELIDRHPVQFGHLRSLGFRTLWKRAGGASRGKRTLGRCCRASGLLGYFLGETAFVIWLAADHLHGLSPARVQVEALLFHELLHAGIAPSGVPTIWQHDFEGFLTELDVYGRWNRDLKDAATHFEQASLFEEGAV